VNILKRVSFQDRMQNCALVSSSWSKAAAEATDSIIRTQPNLDVNSLSSMSRWMRNHGRALSKLQVVLPDEEWRPLVKQSNQQFIRGLAAVTTLTTLSVTCPGVYGCIVPQLASLQSLQQLELVDERNIDAECYLPEP
jgi:hypothetical protein